MLQWIYVVFVCVYMKEDQELLPITELWDVVLWSRRVGCTGIRCAGVTVITNGQERWEAVVYCTGNKPCFDTRGWWKKERKQLGGLRCDAVIQGERALLLNKPSGWCTLQFGWKSEMWYGDALLVGCARIKNAKVIVRYTMGINRRPRSNLICPCKFPFCAPGMEVVYQFKESVW